MIKRLRKWWLCWRYHLCPVHGTYLEQRDIGGYAVSLIWVCETCLRENEAKRIHRAYLRTQSYHLARERALATLNRDWALPKKELIP